MSLFLVFLMYGLWSTLFPIGKLMLTHASPLFLTGSRMLLAGVLLLGWVAYRKRHLFRQISFKLLTAFFFLGLVSIYLTNAFEFWGLQYLSASKTCFLYSLTPFLSALLSYIHFKETMTPRKWLGMVIGVLGMTPVLLSQKGADEGLSSLFFFSWPELAIVGASLCSAYGWILLRKLVKEKETSTLLTNGSAMMIGGSLALIHSLLVENWHPLPLHGENLAQFLKGIMVMTTISNIVCYNLYGLLLKRFTATFLSFMGLLSPIFASITSWLFLGEPLSFLIFLSTSVITVGLWLVYSAELRQGYITKPVTT
jgi:drug/metabolite transporter (DMT)-like permease